MEPKTMFGLLVQLDPSIELDENSQLEIPEPLTHGRVAKDLNPMMHPFIVIATEQWNKMQAKIDELGLREELHALGLTCILIPQNHVIRNIRMKA